MKQFLKDWAMLLTVAISFIVWMFNTTITLRESVSVYRAEDVALRASQMELIDENTAVLKSLRADIKRREINDALQDQAIVFIQADQAQIKQNCCKHE